MADCLNNYYLPVMTGITASDYYTVGNKSISGYTDDSRLIDVFSGLYNPDGTHIYTPGLNTTLLDPRVFFDGVISETADYVSYVVGASPNNISNTGIHYITFKDYIIYPDSPANPDVTPGIPTPGSESLLDKDYQKSYKKTIFMSKNAGRNKFNTTLSAITKQEEYLGVVFKPEVESDVFIKRGIVDIFERHSILSEIKTTNDIDANRGGLLRT